MSLPEINTGVRQRILKQGWIQFLDWQHELDSTNQRAKEWLLYSTESASLPALFVADVQLAGRGRGGKVWFSPQGCLMFTLAIGRSLLPESPQKWSQLALVSAAAVAECVASWIPDGARRVALKWPNDTYLVGRKCSGILVESGAGGARLIGIGINVHVDFSPAPAEVRQRATSMHEHILHHEATLDVRRLDPGQVLADLLELLQLYIGDWSSGGDAWFSVWQRRCLLSGKMLEIRYGNGQRVLGSCLGIDAQGCLMLDTKAGIACIASGEVLSWQ